MKGVMLVNALCVALCSVGEAQAQKPLRLAFAGVTTLTTPFLESMKNAVREAGLSIEVVPVARDLSPRDFSARTRTGLTIALAPSERTQLLPHRRQSDWRPSNRQFQTDPLPAGRRALITRTSRN